MIKFLHAADFHLDAPFSSLRPEAARQRRREQREAVRTLCEAADRNGCDLMLLAGDLFDSDNAFAETAEALERCFRACRAEIFIAPGNHDYFEPGSVYDTVRFSENVHIFRSGRVEAVRLPGCTVYGAAFTAMDSPALLDGFAVGDPDACSLMVLHGEVGVPGSAYNPISEAQIAASGLDYLALGHVHQCSGLRRAGRTAYAWPGCLMGRGFDEPGEKGYLLGTCGKTGCTAEFVPLPGRRYAHLRVQAGGDPLASILEALPPDTARDIYRITLEGEAESPDLRRLDAALRPRFFGLELRDRTEPPRDLWDGCGEETLRGLFLQALREKLDAAETETERQKIAAAARLGLAAMEGREEPEV